MIDCTKLPTHVAKVVARLNVVGPDASADTFLCASYITEVVIKTLALSLCAGMRRASEDAAYGLEYKLVHADGLGAWEAVITSAVSHSYAGHIDQDLQGLVAWFTKKRTKAADEWAKSAARDCVEILNLLGVPDPGIPHSFTLCHLMTHLVRIRNRTKAHGAVGEDFFAAANPHYVQAVSLLLENCPAAQWEWYHLSVRPTKDNVRAIHLVGTDPQHVPAHDAESLRPGCQGVHFRTHRRGRLFSCGDLLSANRECTVFLLPNGGFSGQGIAQYIDYATGHTEEIDASRYQTPPAPLPPSATEGRDALDVFSNIFGNLPPCPPEYVERPTLQEELLKRLMDTNHPIITLHGRGGIGKTSLALWAVHSLSQLHSPPFDCIFWLSARDLELRAGGPSAVRRAVADLEAVCKLVGNLLGIGTTADAFAELLQNPSAAGSTGICIVFDNFETLDDPRGLHKFLDTHTHIPNKVLITSRERAFKGDYPIEIGGMEYDEAKELLRQTSISLGVDNIVTDAAIEEIFEYTEGHAYVMRVLVGEIAKDRRWVPLKSLVPRRSDLLGAVFERSFNKLSPSGRWVFLTVAGWRSVIPELALLVVTGQRSIDVEAGIDECSNLSLVNRHEMSDGQYCYAAPELARLFAKKKLEGDPDRLVIEEDLHLLREFGTLKAADIASKTGDAVISAFLDGCFAGTEEMTEEAACRRDGLMARVAELWPQAWRWVGKFRIKAGMSPEGISYALRRAVEETPYEKEVWLERADFSGSEGDEATQVACLVSAVDADPSDSELVRDVALQLCQYVDAHKELIPRARRGVYLASVRAHMERIADQLDATGLSRLAWLFLLEGGTDGGWEYANMGLAKDSTNVHCLNIVERLHVQGYRPPSA